MSKKTAHDRNAGSDRSAGCDPRTSGKPAGCAGSDPRTSGKPAGCAGSDPKTSWKPAGSDRADLYNDITDRIIAELEAGRVPWVQPWGTAAANAPLAMPRNAVTGRGYSGINVLLLWGAVIQHGFGGQNWLTFRQALSLGGHVRKGERGTTIVYADRFVPREEKRRSAATGEEARSVVFLKRFTVFNADQCESLPEDIETSAPPVEAGLIEPRVEALIAASGIDFRIGGNRAYYSPSHDYVQVPPPQAFFEPRDWHRSALHEGAHATGSPERLDRDLSGSFGSKAYFQEELVAELAAAYACASLGIVPTVRHADYIGGWIDRMREDNRVIFRAASQASKAADWLLSFVPEDGLEVKADTEVSATPSCQQSEFDDGGRSAA